MPIGSRGAAAGSTPAAAEKGERLDGHLTLSGAVALAITIVVGSGILVLPGLAYQSVGRSAVYAWVGAAALTAPLLAIFAKLGAHFPGAGGVAGFVQAAFGRRLAAGMEVLLLGTFGLGIPGIALTGGHYLVTLPGLGAVPAPAAAAAILVMAAAVVSAGVKLSARVQLALAVVLTAGLVTVGLAGVLGGEPVQRLPPLDVAAVTHGVAAIGLVFFAFTGWEMLSFVTEEYADPRRDFPRAVALSFGVVVGMYLLLAWGVQTQLRPGDAAALTSPVRAVVASMATPAVASLVAALGVILVAANVIGATWGASRLVMSSAREGLLPRPLARVRASGHGPRRAVAACMAGFLAITVANTLGLLSLSEVLTVAGQNFFLLYLASAVAYARLFTGRQRLFGVAVSVTLAAVAVTSFGLAQLLYATGLVATGAVISRWRSLPGHL